MADPKTVTSENENNKDDEQTRYGTIFEARSIDDDDDEETSSEEESTDA